MTATPGLTAALAKQVSLLADDLRGRVDALPDVRARWEAEHAAAVRRRRTAWSWVAWRDDRVDQAAVAWVLLTVFVRFCEDNALVRPVWIAGPPERRREALDAQAAYFRANPEHTDREWLQQAVAHLAALPATADLVSEHSALYLVSPSGDAATALLAFWRERDAEGALIHDLTDPSLSARFLGDLYQDLSPHARETYALLQTPEFVEEFILDRALEPALRERPLDAFKLIDPTCGSGHFLLGAFARLLDRWNREAPALETQARVQLALDAIHGVDINPFAVAIARFRLTVAALKECGLRSLESAPAFCYHLAVGDSLLHGPGQATLDEDADLSGFAYSTEDLTQLQTILAGGQYDVVVGNPPYITVKDPELNSAYRQRYTTCKGKYAMTVPFMERFFGLAKPARDGQPAGWAGQITSNSFMKREFGSKLIEDFLARKDLRLVADTSGAYIPGHGTPTVILVGRNQAPAWQTLRAVLGVRGEPGRPDDAAKGIVWTSIVEHVDEPGWDDAWISVADLDRTLLATHPWSLSGGGAVDLKIRIEDGFMSLGARIRDVGFSDITGEDEVFVLSARGPVYRRLASHCVSFVEGDLVRDYTFPSNSVALFPTTWAGAPRDLPRAAHIYLWPYRTGLRDRLYFGKTTSERGLRWYDHAIFQPAKHANGMLLAFAFVATHNHIALDHGGTLFKQSAPVIKLPEGASEEQHLGRVS